MRFRLALAVDNSRKSDHLLPINYQYELSSWIYHTIHNSDNDFANWLHNTGYIHENRKFKLFTFSNLKPAKYKVISDRLQIASQFTELVVSFYIPQTVEHFVTGLFKNQQFKLGDTISSVDFTVQQIERLPDVEFSTSMSFHAVSPIIISKNTEPKEVYARYLSPEEAVYEDLFTNNLICKYAALAGMGYTELNKGMASEETQLYFSMIGKPRQKLIKIKSGKESQTFLKGYLFDFKLSAPVELMRIGYYSGFGEKNSLGFGCCDVLRKT